MQNNRHYTIAASSGRALAESAIRAGFSVSGFDAFADQDTKALATQWHIAPLDSNGQFNKTKIESISSTLSADHSQGLIYGAGFETQPELLNQLGKQWNIIGNSAETLVRISQPTYLASTLKKLNIPHPETRIQAPALLNGWLSKQYGSYGGAHVCRAEQIKQNKSDSTDSRYYQREVIGQEYSFLFLANQQDICPVGFNQPLEQPSDKKKSSWNFTGSVRMHSGPKGLVQSIYDAAKKLTQHFKLQGLNGLDLIVTEQGKKWVLLEINARPTAALQLWDTSPLPALLGLHTAACKSAKLPTSLPQISSSMASAVLYADKCPIKITADMTWPNWSKDLPQPETRIAPGQPICTVYASGETSHAARKLAMARRDQLHQQLALPLYSDKTSNAQIQASEKKPYAQYTCPPLHTLQQITKDFQDNI